MAVPDAAKTRPRPRRKAPVRAARPAVREAGDIRFGRKNYAAFGAALVSIVVGFLLLSRGSITAAPILLVLGYCVLVPYGLAARSRKAPSGE